MKKTVVLSIIAILLAPVVSQAYLETIEFDDTLVEGESLFVVVTGYLPDLCWEYLGDSTNAYHQTLVVYIDTVEIPTDDGCPQVIVPYTVQAVFPDLAADTYTLRIYERRPPLTDSIQDFEIVVTGTVSNDSTAWGAIKALYR